MPSLYTAQSIQNTKLRQLKIGNIHYLLVTSHGAYSASYIHKQGSCLVIYCRMLYLMMQWGDNLIECGLLFSPWIINYPIKSVTFECPITRHVPLLSTSICSFGFGLNPLKGTIVNLDLSDYTLTWIASYHHLIIWYQVILCFHPHSTPALSPLPCICCYCSIFCVFFCNNNSPCLSKICNTDIARRGSRQGLWSSNPLYLHVYFTL